MNRLLVSFLFVVAVCTLLVAVTVPEVEAAQNIRNGHCDEVCRHDRGPQIEGCCRAHGYGGGRCRHYQAFCDH